jgi:hypothetical protein
VSYLIQLITDANGVLVFLKFLTEKFNLSVREMEKFSFDKCSAPELFSVTIS